MPIKRFPHKKFQTLWFCSWECGFNKPSFDEVLQHEKSEHGVSFVKALLNSEEHKDKLKTILSKHVNRDAFHRGNTLEFYFHHRWFKGTKDEIIRQILELKIEKCPLYDKCIKYLPHPHEYCEDSYIAEVRCEFFKHALAEKERKKKGFYG